MPEQGDSAAGVEAATPPLGTMDDVSNELGAMMAGRSRFLRDRGEVKSPDLMERAIQRLRATSGPDLASVLRIVDSCGGAKATDQSDDWNAGYDAALAAVERELTRTWGMLR